MTLTESQEKNAMCTNQHQKMLHFIPSTRALKYCIYIRAAVGLVGRHVVEALSRGSDEGSRKPVVGCFLSTWLCPSSSKPDSTPCCLLCLLLSSRSFPKNASWTQQPKTLVTPVMTVFFKNHLLSFLDILRKHISMSNRNYLVHIEQPLRTDQSETDELPN